MGQEIQGNETFGGKIAKLIPGEIVAAYIALSGMARGVVVAGKDESQITEWAITLILTILTPLYLVKIHRVTYRTQIVLSTLTVPIWIYNVGNADGAFGPWYNAQLGSIILVLWTLALPLMLDPSKINRMNRPAIPADDSK